MMHSRRSLLWISTVLIVSIPSLLATAQAPDAPPDEIAIRTILTEQTNAWNQDDAQAWVRDFSKDADFINIRGTYFDGQAETQKRHAALFSGIFKNSHLEVEVQKVRLLSPKAAVAETVQTLQGYDALPPGIEPTEPGVLKTRMKYVFQKRAGRWKIVSAQNTAISPMPLPSN
jgi:uncharacterized protein (TIGR02246 family)